MTPLSFVLRVVNCAPQEQTTCVSWYVGWLSAFTRPCLSGHQPCPVVGRRRPEPRAGTARSRTWGEPELVAVLTWRRGGIFPRNADVTAAARAPSRPAV